MNGLLRKKEITMIKVNDENLGRKIDYASYQEKVNEIMKKAMEERAAGKQILVAQANKNKKFQKEQLMAQGYTDFVDFYKN